MLSVQRLTLILGIALFGGCSETGSESAPSADATARSGDADNPIDLLDGGIRSDAGDASPMEFTAPLPAVITPPPCGTLVERGPTFISDTELARKAERFDRVFAAFNSRGHGLNADLRVADEAAREAIETFTESTAWTADELELDTLFESYAKAAGLYAGVGLAADAFRYMALRDEGADCVVVERARGWVRDGLHILSVASAVTGTPGVLPRALARRDLPGDGAQVVVPLFDDDGQALPLEKNNGTWRADVSGEHPEYIWEDSCSRDMYVGWVMAYASLWEAIRRDPAFTDEEKEALRTTARSLLASLRQVREDGFDLEIRDADGRRTYHGILNENSIDRAYVPGAPNAFNAIMATGIVHALAYVSEYSGDQAYADDLIFGQRALLDLAERTLFILDLGVYNNFSGSNMAFISMWLAMRYVRNTDARFKVRTLTSRYYRGGDAGRAPAEQSQALYDLVYAMAHSGQSAFEPLTVDAELSTIRAKVATILTEFPDAPFFAQPVVNCDATEIESGVCTAEDGTELPLLGPVGWNDELVAEVPVPMRLRPHSNFYWRSNPYAVNGNADGRALLPANDFRFVYWFGRYLPVMQ